MQDETPGASEPHGSLGAALRRIRLIAAKSLRDVEREIGISNAYLSQLETESMKSPSPRILYKLAECYKVPYESLMELAGYLQRSAESEHRVSALQAALMSAQLTPEEEARVADFIAFLRTQRPKP